MKLIPLFLEHGADASARNNKGHTALYLITGSGRTDLIKMLLKRGVDINVTTANGVTPLMRAARHGSNEDVRTLLAAGADVRRRDKYGHTALATASMEGCAAIVLTLLEAGARVDSETDHGQTPLFLAVQGGNPETVKVLLAHGADVNAGAGKGQSLLSVAIRYAADRPGPSVYNLNWQKDAETHVPKYACIVQLLIDAGADFNARAEMGHTLLRLAVGRGMDLIGRGLLEACANIKDKDRAGYTALEAADESEVCLMKNVESDYGERMVKSAESGRIKKL